MAGRYFGIPFATTGDRITVPDATQPDGSVSFTQGFGFDYERPNTDPAYKPVPRDGTNGLFHDITEALGIAQRQGVSDWTVDAQPYQINALVRHSDKVWRSLVDNNNSSPSEGASWTEIGVAASETISGLIKLATMVQALALSNSDAAISPASLKAVLDATALGRGQTWQDVKASRAFGVTYTNNTGRPIFVSVSQTSGINAAASSQVYVNDILISFPGTPATNEGSSGRPASFFVVPNGGTYRIVDGTPASGISTWAELR